MIPLWSVPRSTSSSARIIPSETSPRSLRRSSVRPFGSTAPGSATATVAPAPKFHAPQTIERGSLLADVDLRQLEPVGIRVLLRLEHLADEEELEVAVPVRDAAAHDAVDLAAREDEPSRELLDGQVELDVLAQPGDGDLHLRTAPASARRSPRRGAGRRRP